MLGSYRLPGATWEMVVFSKKLLSSALLWIAMSSSAGVMRLQPIFWASLPASSRTVAVRYWMMAARYTGALALRRWV